MKYQPKVKQKVVSDLEEAILTTDVLYVTRIQKERYNFIPDYFF